MIPVFNSEEDSLFSFLISNTVTAGWIRSDRFDQIDLILAHDHDSPFLFLISHTATEARPGGEHNRGWDGLDQMN